MLSCHFDTNENEAVRPLTMAENDPKTKNVDRWRSLAEELGLPPIEEPEGSIAQDDTINVDDIDDFSEVEPAEDDISDDSSVESADHGSNYDTSAKVDEVAADASFDDDGSDESIEISEHLPESDETTGDTDEEVAVVDESDVEAVGVEDKPKKRRRRRRGGKSSRKAKQTAEESEEADSVGDVGEKNAATSGDTPAEESENDSESDDEEAPKKKSRGRKRGRRSRGRKGKKVESDSGDSDIDTVTVQQEEFPEGDDPRHRDFDDDDLSFSPTGESTEEDDEGDDEGVRQETDDIIDDAEAIDFSDWNVPSWQEIISSLYRPDR